MPGVHRARPAQAAVFIWRCRRPATEQGTTMKSRSLVAIALGLGLAMAVPAAAFAYTSYTTGSVNLRAGPGVGYASYGALPAGTTVDVRYCQPGWCNASTFMGQGWISSSLLGGARVYPRAYPHYYPAYPYYAPRPFFRPPFGGQNAAVIFRAL